MGLFSRKKKLTKEQREELDKAREQLREESKAREEEIKHLRDHEESRRQSKNSLSNKPPIHSETQPKLIEHDPKTAKQSIENEYRRQQESFNLEASRIIRHSKLTGTDNPDGCSFLGCKNSASFLNGKNCKFCGNLYCLEHIQLERHECVKTTPVKHLRKSWVRKYGQDISTGLYIVACDQCGFRSEIGKMIDLAEEDRKEHISKNGCAEKKVFLEQLE